MVIKEYDLFKEMGQSFMEDFSKIAQQVVVSEGEFLFQRGDPADYFYILEEGRVRLSMGEKEHLSHILKEGGKILGWSSLVGREIYSGSAEALEESKLIKVKREEILDLFEKYPKEGMVFFRRLARIVGERLLYSYEHPSYSTWKKSLGRFPLDW